MRILITNSVPLNGGDEALLRATLLALNEKYPTARVDVLCKDVEACRRQLPDVAFQPDLEFAGAGKQRALTPLRRLVAALRVTGRRALPAGVDAESARATIELYENADLVLSSAGGFLHDYYQVQARFAGLEFAASLKKRVVAFAQSIGPFWKEASIARARTVLPKLHRLFLREELSLRHLQQSRIPVDNAVITADAAFLLRGYYRQCFNARPRTNRKIAVCFRNWKFPHNGMPAVVQSAIDLCTHLLQDPQRELLFLSTCQGVAGYHDDSLLARQIVDQIAEPLRSRCHIDARRRGPEELMRAYGECDAFVGMRLHSALLSMLGGTPAMALGYEDKTEGILRQMGLEPYQVRADAPYADWLTCLRRFERDAGDIQGRLPRVLDDMRDRAWRNLELD
jgi:colanic acid/amylovoran biosynthesis protein